MLAVESSSGITFTPEIFERDIKEYTSKSRSVQPLSSAADRQQDHVRIRNLEAGAGAGTRLARREKPDFSDYYFTSRNPEAAQHLSMVHPALRARPNSGRAGDVAAIDEKIVKNGGTTSTYEQLPHRLKIAKKHQNSAERVIELTRTNGYLLQELAYYKDTRAADDRFHEQVLEMQGALERALKERSRKRADAERALLSYWNIDVGDGNVEDTVF